MERLLAIYCPTLARESDDGAVARLHAALLADLVLFCPFSEVVRYGLFVLPIRGPSRFFGGESAVLESVRMIVARHTDGPVSLGVADGLFSAHAAALRDVVVAPGDTERFRAQLPIEACGLDDFAVTARRLGIHTLGQFAVIPPARVAERFALAVGRVHEVIRGERDVWEAYRDPLLFQRLRTLAGEETVVTGQLGFFGDRTESDRRANAVAHRVTTRLGVDAVWTASVCGGRTPSDRAQWRPWGAPTAPAHVSRAPWPGQLPSPAPSLVLRHPIVLDVFDERQRALRVTARGFLSSPMHTIRFRHGATHQVTSVAGPWPHEESWWSTQRRRAHVHVVLDDERALWLFAERGTWWLAGVFD